VEALDIRACRTQWHKNAQKFFGKSCLRIDPITYLKYVAL